MSPGIFMLSKTELPTLNPELDMIERAVSLFQVGELGRVLRFGERGEAHFAVTEKFDAELAQAQIKCDPSLIAAAVAEIHCDGSTIELGPSAIMLDKSNLPAIRSAILDLFPQVRVEIK